MAINYRPIFIAGRDRSGTTLLGDMLGNTQWTMTTPESQFIHEFVIQMQLGSFENADAAAAWLLGNFRFVIWALPLDQAQLTELIDLNDARATIENLLNCYRQYHHPDKNDADVWVDHTPDNFKFHPILKSLFPEARFIHIVRDGRAVSSSIKPLNWGPNNTYTASRHWANRLQEAISAEVAEGDNCLRIRYEDLVTNPSEVLDQVCEFIGVPFNHTMINGGGLIVPSFTRVQHDLIGKAPQAARANQWRKYMKNVDFREFESHPMSHTLLVRMGYEPVFDSPPSLSMTHTLRCYCHEFFHYLLNRNRHRRMETSTVSAHQKGFAKNNTDLPAVGSALSQETYF